MHAKTPEFSVTDIADFLPCNHLLTLDRAEEAGKIERPFFYDGGVELLRELGLHHEQAYPRYLTDTQDFQVDQIPTDVSRADIVSRTADAIRGGADVVYQAASRMEHCLVSTPGYSRF